jgi:IS5 family transposase
MTDANGLPLSLVVAAANTHDIKLVDTFKPSRRVIRDKNSDSMKKMKQAGWSPRQPHIQSRNEGHNSFDSLSLDRR